MPLIGVWVQTWDVLSAFTLCDQRTQCQRPLGLWQLGGSLSQQIEPLGNDGLSDRRGPEGAMRLPEEPQRRL